MSLYISPAEISPPDLKDIIHRSYATFRVPEVTPIKTLDEQKKLHLLELFHGPTFAFKDVALQFLGNLFEFFLQRKNAKAEGGHKRHHLTVIGATSGDTGSAAIYGLRGKKDVSVFIMYPKGRVSPIQEAQMTTVLDANVHNLAVEGTFDDCQDMVKALFADPEMNKTHHLAAANSINWARILAQITYYFHAYFSLIRSPQFQSGDMVRFVVPTGNFGDILAGFFAKRMGLPINNLKIATNENDILNRFWKTGKYEKQESHGEEAQGGFQEDGAKAHSEGVKETLSPAMDILVSSNFERLLWMLAHERAVAKHADATTCRDKAGRQLNEWFTQLKTSGAFAVDDAILEAARAEFSSQRVSDAETIDTIREVYQGSLSGSKGYILDPHTAIGVAASLRSISSPFEAGIHYISLATAHPAKFANAVDLALRGEKGFDFEKEVLPEEFVDLEKKEKRIRSVARSEGLPGVRAIIIEEVEKEKDV